MESGRDGGEVNGDVKETPSSVVKNSKSEEPRDERQQQHVTNMGKQNDEDLDEGAQERMLQGDDGNAKITEKDNIEVKFISENGDVKIDIEPSKDTLVGMSKEELMKFANDPFWVRLRWALFIFFWLLWIGMLAGAIAIVVIAPKCAAPEPKKFWEESPIIQLDILDSPTNDLKGLELVLSDLKDRHIKAISLSSIVKEDADGTTEDFKALESKLGNISDLENLIKAATEKDQQIFLELDPNHSSVEHPWFKRSVEKEDPYTSYYVWADGGKERQNPPNNWLNVYGESAWEWNEQRGQYYLHQFNKSQPDLNYNNPAMVKEFGDILIHWLKLGISGFRLANTSFLTEDPDLRDEHPSLLPVERNNYQSLVHVYTRNRPENVAILTKWQEIVRNETDGKGLFALQDDISADILQVYNEKKAIIDLPQSSHFLTTANASINATVLRRSISQWLRITSWPAWDLNGKQQSLKHRMPNVADSFTLMTMLLPGTPILRLDDVMSLKDTFATLSNARRGLTFLHGSTTFRVINETVFVYARSWVRSGNPGYLVAYQTGNESAIIDLSEIPQISEEITVVACSPNYIRDPEVRTKLYSNKVPISPKSTLILTFVPKE
ncbi:neutral and basic amino acid transport protein rBAT isoform X1 [Camponotus floridanus]|uniref:neutral and basic amino acid transport protein rBAT isoform X1 n=1 Tax=Camponotus floridanus TaxID=104421 RepID=UPI000DC68CE4|nr:neutral and basic amino acid transport protein rBAT isoform X1 [Camponotus floridanus]